MATNNVMGARKLFKSLSLRLHSDSGRDGGGGGGGGGCEAIGHGPGVHGQVGVGDGAAAGGHGGPVGMAGRGAAAVRYGGPVGVAGRGSKNSVGRLSDESVVHSVNMDSLFKYEELVGLLSCGICEKYCGSNLVQCRKGHVLCKGCKAEGKITSCKTCKQTFVDAPNLVLEKLISMIAFPCRFRPSGCEEFVFSNAKLEHETFCPCRPISCQYEDKGCSQELPYKDIKKHHLQCSYNPRCSGGPAVPKRNLQPK